MSLMTAWFIVSSGQPGQHDTLNNTSKQNLYVTDKDTGVKKHSVFKAILHI